MADDFDEPQRESAAGIGQPFTFPGTSEQLARRAGDDDVDFRDFACGGNVAKVIDSGIMVLKYVAAKRIDFGAIGMAPGEIGKGDGGAFDARAEGSNLNGRFSDGGLGKIVFRDIISRQW